MIRKRLFILCLILFSFVWGGCASLKGTNVANVSIEGGAADDSVDTTERISQLKISEFVLSSGDEIVIDVMGYEALHRKLIIPPDGQFFFPLIGDVEAKGKTLKQLQQVITEGLSKHRRFDLSPGDEIAITVYRNNELNRKLIIPPDGHFYYPLVGEIDTTDKTHSQIREIISRGLSKFVIDPHVSVDIVTYSSPKIIVDPQVSIEVTTFGGQKIFVLGEVNKPGVFTADSGTDIVEVVSKAGGFTLDAHRENVLVIRGGLDNPDLLLLDIGSFLKGKDLTQNIPLQRGDIVYVPASTIANIDRFFKHFATIVNPIVTLETGIVLAPAVEDAFTGTAAGRAPTVIVPPR